MDSIKGDKQSSLNIKVLMEMEDNEKDSWPSQNSNQSGRWSFHLPTTGHFKYSQRIGCKIPITISSSLLCELSPILKKDSLLLVYSYLTLNGRQLGHMLYVFCMHILVDLRLTMAVTLVLIDMRMVIPNAHHIGCSAHERSLKSLFDSREILQYFHICFPV